LRELGSDPDTGQPVVVRDGRFGPYVTDGTINASLRRGDNVESVTLERAAELLAERRAAGPARRPRAARKSAKAPSGTKAAKTRAPGKKAAAKKTPAKKAASPKTGPAGTADP
jgi:DNA topoisomerase-1